MHIRRTETNVEVQAPAKVNLLLEVIRKRADGYHEIETVMAAVTIFDTLIFIPHRDEEIKLDCRWGYGATARAGQTQTIPGGPQNLVWRAAALLREEAGLSQGARISLVKRIPAAAGLGGASSDAAAALVAANVAWKLGWSRERLAELAARLGSDVPFFLTRGAAVARGRGEQIEPFAPPRMHFVIARPPVGLSTPDVYAICRPTGTQKVAGLIESLKQGDTATASRQLSNGLQDAATRLTPWIERLQQEFGRADVLGHQMSGSGSSYFGLCRSARSARRTCARLRARNLGTVFAATTAVGP